MNTQINTAKKSKDKLDWELKKGTSVMSEHDNHLVSVQVQVSGQINIYVCFRGKKASS